MTIKDRLLSSTAIIKRFQTEKNPHPEWQAPIPVRISQPYLVLENHSGPRGGATRPRKSLMISLSISIQYRSVTDGQSLWRLSVDDFWFTCQLQ